MDAAVDRSAPTRLELGRLEILPEAYRASFGGREIPLSPSQLEILTYLVRNRDRVVSRGELADAAGLVEGRSVDVALSSLRRLLGRRAVRNVRNRGWILEPGALGA